MTIEWWTVVLQAVNVIILIWLLARFFWRPVAAMIEQRRLAGQQILVEAQTKRDEANASLVEIERIRAGFESERVAIIAAAHAAAAQERRILLDLAAKEAAELETSARMAMDKERRVAEQALLGRATRLAIEIAERLVSRLGGPTVTGAFLDGLLQEIRTLPDPVRKAMAGEGVVLEAISATALAPADQEHQQQLIADAFGARPKVTFKEDPGLIAGLELHGPHLVIKNSWRADLAKILAALPDDNRS